MPRQSKGKESQMRLHLLLLLSIVSVIGALSSALFLFAEWNELTLQDAIESGQVTAQIHGLAEDGYFMEPMLEVRLSKQTVLPLSVVIPQGVMFSSSSETAAVVIGRTEKVSVFGTGLTTPLMAYSLDYTKGFPNSSSEYELGSKRVVKADRASEEVIHVLNHIVLLKAEHEIASQLAVWRSHQNVQLAEIDAALGRDFSQYAERVNQILDADSQRMASSSLSWRWIGSFILFVTLTFTFATLLRKSRQEKRVIDQLTDWHLLANGGMAQVWVAHDERFQKVMVKFPQTHEEKLYQEIVKYRFETEIEQHKKLHHPNIVPLLEHGDAIHPFSKHATCYLIQQFIDGCTLDELLSQPPLPETIIFEMVAQLLAALGYIHAQEVIHRDLTLKNIMIEKTGQVYLIDFGNSTSIGSQNTEVRGLLNVGTAPFYAPPEIGNVPERDFYALAMVIVAMYGGSLITAQDANQVEKSQEALRAIEQELEHLTNVPEWLQVVLKKCWHGGEYKDSATLRSALRLSPLNQIVTEIKGEESRIRHD